MRASAVPAPAPALLRSVSAKVELLEEAIPPLRAEAQDKAHAYTILHANWVVKDHELAQLK